MNHTVSSSLVDRPLIPFDVLTTPGLLILGVPGSGCSPAIYRQVNPRDAVLHGVDWSNGPGPWTPPKVAARLASLLKRRDGQTVILGHSAGCAIAMLVALAEPQRVHGMVLSNSGAHARGHGDQSLPNKISNAWTAAAQTEFLEACFLKPPTEPLWSELREYLSRLDASVLRDAVLGVRQVDVLAELSQIRCPVSVAHGVHDVRRPVHFAEEIARGIPDAELNFLPGAHTPMVDCPDEYQQEVDRLVARARVWFM